MTADLINRARAGDREAFGRLVEPHQRELQVHCYRILGSVQDAEDALQETLLAAWRGFGGFEERASIRTWLYRIATSRCLNALRAGNRRPRTDPRHAPIFNLDPPEPTRRGEAVWIEPCPDTLLAGIDDRAPGPEAQYEAREAISLAFVTALQLLPPRQRAVLILRDVLGFPAAEVAGLLDTSLDSVTSALKRARAGLRDRFPRSGPQPPPQPGSPAERELIERLTRAYQNGAVDDLVALLTDDVRLTMPPVPLEYEGCDQSARFLAKVAFRDGRTYRLVPTRANGQLAFAAYLPDPPAGRYRADGLLVLTLAGGRIRAMTRFDAGVLPWFRLPGTLPAR